MKAEKITIEIDSNLDEIQEKAEKVNDRLREIREQLAKVGVIAAEFAAALAELSEMESVVKEKERDSITIPREEAEKRVIRLPDKSGGAKTDKAKRSQVDHGRIVALYTANPPRSVSWIADDVGCSPQTVINHLEKEGIYRKRQRGENE